MAGKYDDLRRSNVNIFYVDPFLSLYPESKGYFGGLSVVIHPGDDTRIACGNIIPTSCSDIKICPQT
ncbi:Cell surface superoxide dismutase [Cu-Zn] 4 [Neolecta irregularis DAH-3]|uniref:Cell surface superoxide dismutase [Cu-Zn] 4 n=1 Tax=Neolecta irregularis (strain DAH-3) TaxID=1198029 RepID=A0A1U7LID1_NEOID|nr:Cell surface superoxide dismutase [Cu-Zn] 4 [Neolecta irregularis DAH-3]|eukprot:OLL22353.1 Cell surface superoxide dismutase [Cu-Zn] 4 [Neolecta irregularis DAH-3]